MEYIYLDILDEMQQKYTIQLNDKLVGLRIVQSDEGCYIHSEYSDNPGCLFIENLDFISDDDYIPLSDIINPSLFNPQLGIKENARRFIEELDAVDLAMCFDRIII